MGDDIVFKRLDGESGYYDHASGKIYLDPREDMPTLISTLMHERIHKELGHEPLTDPGENVAREVMVEGMAARRLISFPELLGGMVKHRDVEHGADEFGVDSGTVRARILGLTPLEQAVIQVCGRHCIGFLWAQDAKPGPETRPNLVVVAA